MDCGNRQPGAGRTAAKAGVAFRLEYACWRQHVGARDYAPLQPAVFPSRNDSPAHAYSVYVGRAGLSGVLQPAGTEADPESADDRQ